MKKSIFDFYESNFLHKVFDSVEYIHEYDNIFTITIQYTIYL